jgi:hypothetical protein
MKMPSIYLIFSDFFGGDGSADQSEKLDHVNF